MYEMHPGPAATGTSELVWHIMADVPARLTLCGRQLPPPGSSRSSHAEEPTESHCSPCMTAFRDIVQTPSGLSRTQPGSGT
ncbi:hypothetical protein ADL22_23430 [Streptomyces sp. NRRL F-4489]|uniref:hypothetical protein n=1 Tax=Streptomyces sp. NRRL F-4489 TaxID=1609095 RepID=UPI00074A6B62|nr:hypothetical protein [Streptomyces sp. NRRL F-4489]KUL36854.1 hypothetical protein ADL22_23430 [Streptomyces sp. NRRL F-4489]